jgi:feruloyl esterase
MDVLNHFSGMKIQNMQIVSATYEEFSTPNKTVNYYRLNCETSYGERSFIRTEIFLPDGWNGIFIGLGNGGMAGFLDSEGTRRYALEGYAAAQTDMGTSSGRLRGIGNPDVWKDFGWRATHGMTEIAKEIISQHYGKAPDYSYFIGGSTGGQQAFSEAQRFPADYNGIIAEKPANNRVFLHTYFLWNHRHLRTAGGTPLFSDRQIEKITACAVEFFKARGDGEQNDPFIDFPYNDRQTVSDFVAYLNQRIPEFGVEQLDALRAVYNGPVNPVTGKQIYNGMPIGSEKYYCGIKDCQDAESPHFYPFIWTFGEDYTGMDFDFNRDLQKVSETLSADLNANSTDLSAFQKRGGKMIVTAGTADPCVPHPDNVIYYERLCKAFGGHDALSQFFRFFLFPGRDHGGCGDGYNETFTDASETHGILTALRLWCEEGQAPESLFGVHRDHGETAFSKKIYPYGSKQCPKKEMAQCCDSCFLEAVHRP